MRSPAVIGATSSPSRGARRPVVPIVLAAVLMLSACNPVIARRADTADLVGTWVFEDAGHESVMTIREDGTFTISDAPAEVFDPERRLAVAYSVAVDWSAARDVQGEIAQRPSATWVAVREPDEWSVSYQLRLTKNSLVFGYGNADNDVLIHYYRDDPEP